MNKILCSLLVLAFIGTASCDSFKRIHFDQGKAHFERNLEVVAPKVAGLAGNHSNQTTVQVKILEDFLRNNTLDTTVNTSMAVFLSTSETGFCYNCNAFVQLECTGECLKSSQSQAVFNGRHYIRYAYQIKNDTTFVTLGDAWKLTTRPLSFSYSYLYGESLPTNNSYGFIGLGAFGNARSNFQGTDAPLFSVSVNGTGKGSLIFGNDTKLVQTGRKDKYLTWNTSLNWVAETTSLSYKTKNITYKSKIHFDLNQVGSNFTWSQWSDIRDALNLTTNSTATLSNGEFQCFYNATAKGPISKQPPLLLTIDGKNVSIPIEALFKKHEDTKNHPAIYTFMAYWIDTKEDYNATSSGTTTPLTIFGSYFLSNFYTVFHSPSTEAAYVQLFPNFTPFTDSGSSSSSGGSGGKFLIGLIAVIGLGAVGFIVFRNKAASKLQEHLNEK